MQTQVDLLFFGGIGTFIKSQIESHTAVADRANDSVRVDARIIKAKISGEGANLGLTQLGRIEYALNGGRINTDAIDNSAGVDCSDHEVNLKIMCQVLLQKKAIHNNQRDELLASLANEVSELVLYDNWMQTLALKRMQQESMTDINAYSILIKKLETSANLPLRREVENIPSDEELQQRKNQHLGITRPELAILLAYSKIHLYQDEKATDKFEIVANSGDAVFSYVGKPLKFDADLQLKVVLFFNLLFLNLLRLFKVSTTKRLPVIRTIWSASKVSMPNLLARLA